MARELQMRYPEYTRRKTVPFRLLVEQAYKTVLHSYGLDSNPSSDDEDDDDLQEIGDGANSRQNQLGDTLNNLYTGATRPPRVQAPQLTNDDAPIDISSDDSEDDEKEEEQIATVIKTSTPVTENGTAAAKVNQVTKKRRYDEIRSNSSSSEAKQHSTQAATAVSTTSRPKKYKKTVTTKQSKVTFDDVGGMDKTLKQLCELLLHLKHPEIYNHIGLPPPRGFLLHGPPGLIAFCSLIKTE